MIKVLIMVAIAHPWNTWKYWIQSLPSTEGKKWYILTQVRNTLPICLASPAQDLYWFVEKRRAPRLQHPPPPHTPPSWRVWPLWRANLPLADSSGYVPVCRLAAASSGHAAGCGITANVLCAPSCLKVVGNKNGEGSRSRLMLIFNVSVVFSSTYSVSCL